MIRQFKCRECNQLNEFETEGAVVRLREAAEVSPGRTYFVECKWCGTKNMVTILEEEE
jgi:RNase P subunit RPR2